MKRIHLLIIFVLIFAFKNLNAQNCGAASFKYIKASYDEGRFWNCLDTIESCLKKNGYTRDEKVVAFAFKAKVYLAIDSIYKAREIIQSILLLRDNYEPSVDDPDRFKNQFFFVKQQLQSNTITSVSKKVEKLELAPATIQIITAEEIKNRGYQNIENLLNDIPGFDVSRTNGSVGTTFYQRGYRSANTTDKTMILVDGVEDNEMFTQFGYLGKHLPVQLVKRVEIIYGPASSLYGANAFCGVINIITKDPNDLFKKKVTDDINQEEAKTETNLMGQINAGSFNTKSLEMSGAVKLKNGITIQGVGRYFTSDENNLSKYKDWDGKWTESDFGVDWYKNTLTVNRNLDNKRFIDSFLKLKDPTNSLFSYNSDSTKIIPTATGIQNASNLDQKGYNTVPLLPGAVGKRDDPRRFNDASIDQYLMVKVTLGDLVLEAQVTDRSEGSCPDFNDKYVSVNANFTNWEVRQQFISSKYNKRLGDKWYFYNFAYYRISDFGQNSRVTSFNGYAQKALDYTSLLQNTAPQWLRTSYYQQCKQFRDEFRVNYIINERWDVMLGFEVRNGVFQVNYLTTTASDNAILTGTVPPSPGGNNLAVFDLSAYSQIAYQNPAKKFNFSLGGRWDKNVVSENSEIGYGSTFNPRLSMVYYPGSWVYKFIYSQAIFAFPNFTTYSTSATRVKAVNLVPEKVNNYEFSVNKSLLGNTLNTELALYRSEYSESLESIKTKNDKDQYVNSNGIGTVYGAQLSVKYVWNKRFDFYLNSTFNKSFLIDESIWNRNIDTTYTTADIAVLSYNFGAGVYLFKQKAHFQLMGNYVGQKLTGPGTTIADNLAGAVPAFFLLNSSLNFDIFKNFNLQFRINNILDVKYFSPGVFSGTGPQSSNVPQPFRNFNMSMNFTF